MPYARAMRSGYAESVAWNWQRDEDWKAFFLLTRKICRQMWMVFSLPIIYVRNGDVNMFGWSRGCVLQWQHRLQPYIHSTIECHWFFSGSWALDFVIRRWRCWKSSLIQPIVHKWHAWIQGNDESDGIRLRKIKCKNNGLCVINLSYIFEGEEGFGKDKWWRWMMAKPDLYLYLVYSSLESKQKTLNSYGLYNISLAVELYRHHLSSLFCIVCYFRLIHSDDYE